MKTHQKIFIIFALTLTGILALTFSAQAGGYDDASWYVSLDVEQARAKLVPHLSERTKNNNDFEFTALTPVGVNHATFYGQSNESSTLTMILSGKLGDFSAMDFIQELEKQAGEDANISLLESTANNGHTIDHFVIKGDEKNKSFYTAQLNPHTIIASFSKDEVLNWSNDKYAYSQVHQTGLVNVKVKIESAIMHMGADIDQGSQPFQSKMFQKIKQISASLIEDSEDLLFETALVTEDDATAKQVVSVINGLVAMNALSDLTEESKALHAILKNLSITTEKNQVMIFSQLPLSLLSEIDFD